MFVCRETLNQAEDVRCIRNHKQKLEDVKMKKLNPLAMTVVAFVVVIVLIGCATISPDIPFNSKQYRSNKNYFKASQSGESPDLSTAKKIALLNSKTELAGNIQSTIKSVTEQYTNQKSVSDKKNFEGKFEQLGREVVNQELVSVKIIGEKVMQNRKTGFYTYYIAIETPCEKIKERLEKEISKDELLQLEYDKQLYEKIYNEEMSKLENQ